VLTSACFPSLYAQLATAFSTVQLLHGGVIGPPTKSLLGSNLMPLANPIPLCFALSRFRIDYLVLHTIDYALTLLAGSTYGPHIMIPRFALGSYSGFNGLKTLPCTNGPLGVPNICRSVHH
jgi:hypothetical protein